MSDLAKLIESEISDFCATLQQPSEPEIPAEIQAELMRRIMPLINSVKVESAALRGTQKPVGIVTQDGAYTVVNWKDSGKLIPHGTELFTHPAKPVVLPAYKFCPAEYQGTLLWSETEVWNKAIDAAKATISDAGIVVKDGE